jgi:2-keto-3-deoxy-L-rhamnonate aldolase RhmA
LDNHINRFKQKIKDGQACVGVSLSFTDPAISELFAEIGYDFTWIDMEHSPITIDTALAHLMAVRGTGTAGFVRVPSSDPNVIKPVLELHPAGLIVPMVCSAQEAQQIVKACKYPPHGTRGYGPRRGIQFGKMPVQDYLKTADNQTLVIIQIEHIDAVNNLDEILKVDGIDSICIGPNDLTGSMGILGQMNKSEYIEICDVIIEKVRRTDKMLGIATGYDMANNGDNIRKLIEKGVQWVALNTDFANLYTYSQMVYDGLRHIENDLKT